MEEERCQPMLKCAHSTCLARTLFLAPRRMTPDARFDALCAWLGGMLPSPMLSIEPASADASFRSYFRITLADEHSLTRAARRAATLIAMDAPPSQRGLPPLRRGRTHAGRRRRAFTRRICRSAGRGFPLVERPWARKPIFPRSRHDRAGALSRRLRGADPLAALEHGKGCFPHTTRRCSGASSICFRTGTSRGMSAYRSTSAARHVGCNVPAHPRQQPRAGAVYVHRDYHSRNLMVCRPEPRRARFSGCGFRADHLRPCVPAARRLRRMGREPCRSTGRRATGIARGRPSFRSAQISGRSGAISNGWACSGSSRCSGIFARLYHRDGKDSYLKEMPRVMRYLRDACSRYRRAVAAATPSGRARGAAARHRLQLLTSP